MSLPDFDWEAFRALSGQLERLVEHEADDETAEIQLAMSLRRILSLLYTSGITMPGATRVYDAAGGDGGVLADLNEPEIGVDLLDPVEHEARSLELAARIARSAVELDTLADDVDRDDFSGIAARETRDVVIALSEGSRLWDAGRREAAAWEWAFQFDDWGAHALQSLTALHALVWGAGE